MYNLDATFAFLAAGCFFGNGYAIRINMYIHVAQYVWSICYITLECFVVNNCVLLCFLYIYRNRHGTEHLIIVEI